MSNINDTLREKFEVGGSNIAETLSKITPGSKFLVVGLTKDTTTNTTTANKTVKEITSAAPFVVFVSNGEGEINCMWLKKYSTALHEGNYYIHAAAGDNSIVLTATSLDGYPTYVEDNTSQEPQI